MTPPSRTGPRLRVLVALQPFESHVRALWSAINALLALGHEVRVAAAPNLAGPISHSYEFPYVKAGMDWTATPDVAFRLASALSKGNEDFCRLLITDYLAGPQVVATARDLLVICKRWRPDAIVSDLTDFGSSLIAELLGIKQLRFDNGWAGIFSDSEDLLRSALAPRRLALGLPEAPADQGRQTTFTPTPEGLLLPQMSGHSLVHYQHENPRRKGDSLPPWFTRLPLDRPLVYVSLGSILTRSEAFLPLLEPQYHRIIRALEALGDCNAIVSVGPLLRRRWTGRSNVRIVTSVPQPTVLLAGCDAFVTHGGASSIREGVIARARMILSPLSSDQFRNADRCSAHGLGRVIAPDASVAEIAEHFRSTLAIPKSDTTALDWQRRTLALPTIGKLLPRYLERAS